MSDINLDTQEPQEPQDGYDAPVKPVTFIIMRDMDLAGTTAPVFVAYVDVPSPQYEDIGDPDSYTAPRRVLQTFIDVNQPDGIGGTWWVARVPATQDPYTYDSGMRLERFNVRFTLEING